MMVDMKASAVRTIAKKVVGIDWLQIRKAQTRTSARLTRRIVKTDAKKAKTAPKG